MTNVQRLRPYIYNFLFILSCYSSIILQNENERLLVLGIIDDLFGEKALAYNYAVLLKNHCSPIKLKPHALPIQIEYDLLYFK